MWNIGNPAGAGLWRKGRGRGLSAPFPRGKGQVACPPGAGWPVFAHAAGVVAVVAFSAPIGAPAAWLRSFILAEHRVHIGLEIAEVELVQAG